MCIMPAIRTGIACLMGVAAVAHAEQNPGLTGRMAYYPGHNKVEMRMRTLPFLTDDGKAGLRGEYFDNAELEGEPALTRINRRIDFNWKDKAPAKNLPKDNFSVRWTGQLPTVPRTDTYQWTFSFDDGMRAWVGDKQILDVWDGAGKETKRVKLQKGTAPKVRVEYRDTGGGARASVRVTPLGMLYGDLIQTPEGKPGLKVEYFHSPELEGEPAATKTVPDVSFHGFRAPGKGGDPNPKDFGIRWTGKFGPVPETGTYIFKLKHDDGGRLWVDDVPVYNAWDSSGETSNVRVELRKGETVDMRFESNRVPHGGVGKTLSVRMARRTVYPEPLTAGLRIVDEDGQIVQEQKAAIPRYGTPVFAEIDPIEPGTYTVELDSGANVVKQLIYHQDFAWENNDLGITDKIYPPFEPITVSADTASVVLRRYHFGKLGLPARIEARGQDQRSEYRELLAGPIALIANGEPIKPADGQFVETSDREVVYEGSGTHPAVSVHTRTTTEFDGCMKVELTLAPKAQPKESNTTDRNRQESAGIESLVLEIPLKDEMVPLFHVVKGATPIRQNPAGATPWGEGKVWDSTRVRDNKWPGNFKPYIWLGGASRGLSWFADNEKGWIMDWHTTPPCQTLHRDGDTVTLRVHLGQKAIKLKEPRTITFGLMASPAKPMPENWRRVGRPDAEQIHFRMGQLFGLDAVFAAKYPRGKDFSPFEKFYAIRTGENVNINAFVRDWAENHLHDTMSGKLKNRYQQLMRIILRHAGKVGQNTYFTSYFDEFRSTIVWHEEMKSYWAEWTREFENPWSPFIDKQDHRYEDWNSRPKTVDDLKWGRETGTIGPSYRNFGCYYAAEWLKKGVGIYFDNAFPQPAYNLINTSAYVRDDGRIQPSAGIWARRQYLRRIWVLHQELFDPKAPQIMMLHMTNTHVLPYGVWNQATLDLEWKMNAPAPFQTKFSPALLRAESIGLQSGNYPMAMVQPGKKRKTPKGMTDEQFEAIDQTYRYGLYIHEIKYAPNISTISPPQPMVDFGYGLEDCEVWNYWDDDAPLGLTDSKCKWLLLKRQGKLLLVLATWNKNEADITATLDLDALGLNPVAVKDAKTGAEVADITEGAFAFNINGFGVHALILAP